ncbi:hypothetical protein DL96DRAFT_1716824 [Flagelloscypha sp. PMI_526]|nr:hypothetical protein DL96DRAFT_1716824 [Flagelloscypha sp. PMI_526]
MAKYDRSDRSTQHLNQDGRDVRRFRASRGGRGGSSRHPLDSVPKPLTSPDDHHQRSRFCHPVFLPDTHLSPLTVPALILAPGSMQPVPQSKEWVIPSVVPHGYPEGTKWAACSPGGWPRLVTPEGYPVRRDIQAPAIMLAEQEHDPRASGCQSQFHPTRTYPDDRFIVVQREPPRLSQMTSSNTQHPRRSRSHSRSRSDHDAHPLDPNAPPVPQLPLRTSRQQKEFPIPQVVPPGYPEDTRWTVGLNGRPQLEASCSFIFNSTPDQFRARYGVSAPAVAPAREGSPNHAQQHVLDSQTPAIASKSPQKPILKRILRGLLGSNKRAEPSGLPTDPVPNTSQPLFKTERLSRTKSM